MESEEAHRPNPLYEELLWVHSAIRRDLEIVGELATRAADGLEPALAKMSSWFG